VLTGVGVGLTLEIVKYQIATARHVPFLRNGTGAARRYRTNFRAPLPALRRPYGARLCGSASRRHTGA
jgi:hypothetical protein